MKFKIIKEAGILYRHVAELMEVSTVTVSRWVNGRGHPQQIDRWRRLLVGIQKAIDKGLLPPQHSRFSDEYIMAVLRDIEKVDRRRKTPPPP